MHEVSRTHEWSLVSDDRNRTAIGRVSAVYRGVDLLYSTFTSFILFYDAFTFTFNDLHVECIAVNLKRRNEMRQRQIVRQGIGSYLKIFFLIWFGQ